jgi:hypothetical protein
MSRIVKNPPPAPTKLYTIWLSLYTHFRQAAVYVSGVATGGLGEVT